MKANKNSLGDRIKNYESVADNRLIRRMPVILRLDGCHFHTFTKGFNRPFDDVLIETMQRTMLDLCKSIQGCVLGYTQSDEITLVLVDYQTYSTDSWFDNRIQKICSVASSMATRMFNKNFMEVAGEKAYDVDYKKYASKFFSADFDCRAFNVPKEDVCNCLIWRQKDAERNSVLMVAQSLYSHKEILGISCKKLQDKMFTEKGVNWNDIDVPKKRGTACRKNTDGAWELDLNMPILVEDRDYVESLINFKGDKP